MIQGTLLTVTVLLVLSPSTFAEVLRTISVVGVGSTKVEPDSAEIEVAVSAVDKDAAKAKTQVDQAMSNLLELAKQLEISPDDISATQLHVHPQVEGEKSEKIIGYEATRHMTLTLRDIKKLDKLLTRCFEAGINQIGSITLKSSKEEEYKRKALTRAIDDAKEQAKSIAAEFGAELGKVHSIVAEGAVSSYSSPIQLIQMYSADPSRYHPGRIEIEAKINAEFQLK